MRLPLHPKAELELEHAALEYETEETGLGRRLLTAVMARITFASRFQKAAPRVPGLPVKFDVRRFVVRDFPFAIITAQVGQARVVLAVAPMKRPPDYWHDRLQ